MRRDFGGEIIAAIAAVALLSFAIAFGILLSVSNTNPDETATNTPADVAVDDPSMESNVDDTIPEIEETTIVDNATEEEITEGVDTLTEEATATDSNMPESSTPDETLTDETLTDETLTDEPSNIPRPSNTPTQPTATAATPRPTHTHTATVEPSNTPTRPRPSRTPSATATSTEVPTRISIITETPEPTSIPTQTEAIGGVPLFTPQGTEDIGVIPPTRSSSSNCPGAPASWPIYVVQPGNTLYSIAVAVDSTVEELSEANCISNINRLHVGIELAVPRLPQGIVETGVPSTSLGDDDNQTAQPEFQAIGCTHPLVQITSPEIGATITATFDVIGKASWPNFQYYNIEIRADNATTYSFYSDSFSPVPDGFLGRIDPSLFEPGIYWVRLVIVDNTGNIPNEATCAIPMIFS